MRRSFAFALLLASVATPVLAQTPNDPQQRERQLAEFEKIKAGF